MPWQHVLPDAVRVWRSPASSRGDTAGSELPGEGGELQDLVGRALAEAERRGWCSGLLLIDLEPNRPLLDQWGHGFREALLRQVEQRLRGACRARDRVVRVGADAMAVLMERLGARPDLARSGAMQIAQRLHGVLERVYPLPGLHCPVTVCIGVTVFPDRTACADDLLNEVAVARRHARFQGLQRVVLFEPAMLQALQRQEALRKDIEVGIRAGQFTNFVQPQFDALGSECGAEVLSRWLHPKWGFVATDQFMPVAKATGLIALLDVLALRTACMTLGRIQRAERGIPLAVNVSQQFFWQDDFVDQVEQVLGEFGAEPTGLVLELPEAVMTLPWRGTRERLQRLADMGVRLSLDDFGPGMTNLAHLSVLPLKEIKIHRSLTKGLPQSTGDRAIVEAILALARPLELRVAALGVEHAAQREFLLAHGCTRLQGRLLAEPEPLAGWLGRRLAALGHA